LYIAHQARPDCSFAVQLLARHVSAPTTNAVRAAKQIVYYLSGTPRLGPAYSVANETAFNSVYKKVVQEGNKHGDSLSEATLSVFVDADFAGCVKTFKSTSGSIAYVAGTPVYWQARRQSCRALSTCEAEYMSLFDGIVLTARQGHRDLFSATPHTLYYVDNKSALDIASQSLISSKSKHIKLRFHHCRDHVKSLCWVPTELNKSDPLTKGGFSNEKYISMFYHSPNVQVLAIFVD
jgi:hypothetical protein